MKLRFLSILFISLALFGFKDDCDFFNTFDVDQGWTYTNYNAKGKTESTVKQLVTRKFESGDTMMMSIHSTVQADKQDPMSMTYDLGCNNDVIYMSMQRMAGDMMTQMEGMELSIDAEQLEYPGNPSVGDVLPEAELNLVAGMNGMEVMKMTIIIKNRKVIGRETTTTSAGTFDCYIIEQTSFMNSAFMKREFNTKEWFSPKHGMIRSENYNKKGKLDSYSELTALIK